MASDDSTGSSNPPDSGGSTDSSAGSAPTGAGGSAIGALTDNMTALKKHGKPDLKLSTEARDSYLNVIKDFRDRLQAERDKMSGLETLGNVGTYNSANQTKSNLINNVIGFGGIESTLDGYLDYLDAFEATVKKAADRLIQSG